MTAESPRPAPKTGERLPALLLEYGIDLVFGIPGVHNVELYRGLLNSGVRHVLTRHEQGAGFMADGYARVTGRPAGCFVITGPGLTNLMTPLGQAYSDSMPLLAIASTLDVADIGQARSRLHEMKDQRAAAETVTASAVTATASADVPRAMARAFAAFAASRPRPAYVEIPIDVLQSEVDGDWEARPPVGAPAPDPHSLANAAAALSAARRPALLIGGGAVDAWREVRALVERLRPLVVTTIAGKGVVPESDPLNVGATLGRPSCQEALAAADVVLALGTELSETDHWAGRLAFEGTLVRVDIDPSVVADDHGADIALVGDVGVTARALLEQIDPQGEGPGIDVDALRARLDSEIDDRTRLHAPVLDALRRALPEDTAVVTDMTQLAYAGNELFPVEHPRSWIHPVGFGTLGYALPAAIGAKLGAPDRPVVAIAGDYGFQYTLAELAVAAEHDVPVVMVVWNNDRLGAIQRDMINKGIEPVAVEQRNPDFLALGRAYGCPTHAPGTLDEIGPAIAAALEHRGPSLVELRQSRLVE